MEQVQRHRALGARRQELDGQLVGGSLARLRFAQLLHHLRPRDGGVEVGPHLPLVHRGEGDVVAAREIPHVVVHFGEVLCRRGCVLLRRGADVAVGVKERLLVHRPRLRPATAVDGAHDCPEILHSFDGGCEFCGDELDLVRPHRPLQLLLRGSAKKLVARLSTSPPAIRLCPVARIHERHQGHRILRKPSFLSPLSPSAHRQRHLR
mmetsp:Transcript_42940/g.79596  ORF Transcript_42940/g.79596 Transcript_42940/m.79596 type:complete len:207 (+) Transcript_42940:261-881(+)